MQSVAHGGHDRLESVDHRHLRQQSLVPRLPEVQELGDDTAVFSQARLRGMDQGQDLSPGAWKVVGSDRLGQTILHKNRNAVSAREETLSARYEVLKPDRATAYRLGSDRPARRRNSRLENRGPGRELFAAGTRQTVLSGLRDIPPAPELVCAEKVLRHAPARQNPTARLHRE